MNFHDGCLQVLKGGEEDDKSDVSKWPQWSELRWRSGNNRQTDDQTNKRKWSLMDGLSLSETVVRDVHTETTLGPRGMGGRDPCFTL